MDTKKVVLGVGAVGLAGLAIYMSSRKEVVPPPWEPPPDGYGSIQLRGDDWNMVVYPGETGDIVSLMESIAGYGLLVYYYMGDGEWQVYWPEFNINTISTLVYGNIYQIHVNQSVVWHVPLPQ